MSPWYALIERLHGHLAILGLALLLHPIVMLRAGRRPTARTRLVAELGAALLLVPFAVGLAIYPAYRQGVKPGLLAEAPVVTAQFEVKEHLAALAVALAVGGAVTLRAGGRHPEAWAAARSLLLAAWCCGVGAGLLGLWVASRAGAGP